MDEIKEPGIKQQLKVALIIIVLLLCKPLSAEVELNGFASFAVGKVIEGEEFLADYPKTSIYDTRLSLDPYLLL